MCDSCSSIGDYFLFSEAVYYLSFSKVTKPLLETSRRGYLAAISASSYSYVSLLKHFLPIMNPGMSISLNTAFFGQINTAL